MKPHPPLSLNAFAKELLDLLAGHPEAAEIVIGGGVALAHYLDYRDTVDLDAWWRTAPVEAAERLMAGSMRAIADRHGLEFKQRAWGCQGAIRPGATRTPAAAGYDFRQHRP
jgi:hypothetical protein